MSPKTKTRQRAANHPDPIEEAELCLRRQLPRLMSAEDLAALERELSALPTSNERCLLILERWGPAIIMPPGPNENKLLDEIVAKVEACRRRDISQGTLIVYLARFAIPHLSAYDDDEM